MTTSNHGAAAANMNGVLASQRSTPETAIDAAKSAPAKIKSLDSNLLCTCDVRFRLNGHQWESMNGELRG
jgi:hypothetical protein